jgi:acetoin:2,6-dichlorophenolindophenol oxidoreductase subunit alpha
VYEAAHEVVSRTRSGEGPCFLEFKTYRWHHHFEGGYFPDLRPQDGVESWKGKCPVRRFEKKLKEDGILDTEEIEAIEQDIITRIDDAVNFAVESPYPDPEDALEGVYSE